MSKLRAILETPVGPKRIPVTHETDGMIPVQKDGKPVFEEDGKTPKLKKGKVTEELAALFGMPDATYLALQQWDEKKKEGRAAIWTAELANRHGGNLPKGMNAFTADDVFPVMLVTHYLETAPGEEPMSDIEVAHYSKEHGMDFGKLYAAALQIVGNTDEAQGLDPTAKVGVGNS